MSSAPTPAAIESALPIPRRASFAFTILACALFVVLGIVTTLLGLILPFLTARWSISNAQAGTLFSWQFVTSILGTLSGAVLNKRGFKLPALLGITLCLIGVGALVEASWMVGHYAIACYGFGLGVSIPALNLAVAEANPARRAASVSLVNFSWGVGAICGPVLLRVTHNLNLFLLSTSIMLAAGLIVASASAMPARNAIPNTQERQKKVTKAIWTLAPLLAFSMFVLCGVENSINGWASSLALPHFSNAYTATSANIAFWTFFLAARALAPVALRYVSEARLLVVSILLGTSGLLLFFVAAEGTTILLACALAGFGIGPGFPLLIARVSELIGSEHPAATICFAFAGFGAATLPAVMGVIGTRFGQPRAELAVPFLALLLVAPAARRITHSSVKG